MIGPRYLSGSLPPLFERLIDHEPSERSRLLQRLIDREPPERFRLLERLIDVEPSERPMALERMADLEPSERSMLLQRLVEFESSERSGALEQLDRADANFLRGADLRESVVRAIRRLLDTRRHVPLAEAAQGGDLTVLDYGIPDFGNRSPADSEARFLFGLAIKHALEAFEPRLKDVEVEVLVAVGNGRDLDVIITGSISDGRMAEQVTFRSGKDGKDIKPEPNAVE